MPFSEITPPLNNDSECIIPAHISRYLKSNGAPDDRDIADITKIVRDIRKALEKIDEGAKEPARAIETLQRRRAAMLETQSKLRSILSPLRRFPAEILYEIFLHTIERHGYSVLEASDGPWSLSYVSRHWRDTALAYSGTLWSNMNISILSSGSREDHLSLLRTCLNRSCSHDISVHLKCSHISPTFDDKDKEMVQLLVDNCERWYSLEISDYCLEMPSVLGDVRGRIPNLTNLVLRRQEPAGASTITAFEIAPKLRAVEIHGGFGVALGPESPSLISYKDYRRSGPGDSLDEYFTIFRSCRNLETFTKLHAYQGSLPSHAQSPPIFLPQLRHFQGSHRDLIQSVTTPNLESFHLDVLGLGAFSDNLNALLNVRDLIIRSGCQSLSKLTISNAVTIHILNILPLVPALAILQFQFSRWQDGHRDAEEDIFRSLFQQMTDVDEVGMLKVVPNLREFSFTVSLRRHSRILCIDGIFLDMVATRAKTLEKVEVRGTVPGDSWSPQQVSVFERLLKEGMDISLNSIRPWEFLRG